MDYELSKFVIDVAIATGTWAAIALSLWLALRKPRVVERISFLDFFKKAEKKLGGIEVFVKNLTQAAGDGKIEIYGRAYEKNSVIRSDEILTKILPEYWAKYEINYFSITLDNQEYAKSEGWKKADNSEIKSKKRSSQLFSIGQDKPQIFNDLHLNKKQAEAWIKKYKKPMPEISRFFGITICMYFNDHNPPHFHVKYENFRAAIDIKSLSVIDGNLPPRVLAFAIEWASIHGDELMANWSEIIATGNFSKIQPLT